MKTGHRWGLLPLLAAILLFCFSCFSFRSTDRSMVRVILLDEEGGQFHVGLIYQAPEASADSADAVPELCLSSAKAEDMAQALRLAERALSRPASYRLCDYILLCSGGNWSSICRYEQLIMEEACGRLSAKAAALDTSLQALTERSEEGSAFTARLLALIKDLRGQSPELYEINAERYLLLPLLHLGEDTILAGEDGVLLTEAGAQQLSSNRMQAALLILKRPGIRRFALEGQTIELRSGLHSFGVGKEGAYLEICCRVAENTLPPTKNGQKELDALLNQTLGEFAESGIDLGRLGESTSNSGTADSKNTIPHIFTTIRQWIV